MRRRTPAPRQRDTDFTYLLRHFQRATRVVRHWQRRPDQYQDAIAGEILDRRSVAGNHVTYRIVVLTQDLKDLRRRPRGGIGREATQIATNDRDFAMILLHRTCQPLLGNEPCPLRRSEERRVGKACVSTWSTRWAP